ncbi:hypothetical protein, partial [Thorsellia kenyensis]
MKKAGIFAKMPKIRHQYEKDFEKPNIPNKLNREYKQLRIIIIPVTDSHSCRSLILISSRSLFLTC